MKSARLVGISKIRSPSGRDAVLEMSYPAAKQRGKGIEHRSSGPLQTPTPLPGTPFRSTFLRFFVPFCGHPEFRRSATVRLVRQCFANRFTFASIHRLKIKPVTSAPATTSALLRKQGVPPTEQGWERQDAVAFSPSGKR